MKRIEGDSTLESVWTDWSAEVREVKEPELGDLERGGGQASGGKRSLAAGEARLVEGRHADEDEVVGAEG
jgi:hypothetical protein